MVRSNFGAVRLPLLAAAVLASFAASLSAQVVEKGRTLSDLIASHPCDTGLTNRIARVTDCDSATDFGDGGGAFNCWAYCDGSAPWTNLSIGGGAGGGAATALESPVVIEGTTADAFEGNFTFADPTADWTWAWGAAGDLVGAGSLSIDNLKLDGNTISSTDTNGNIALTPNGTGRVVVPLGSLTAPGVAVFGITGTGFTFDEGSQRGVSWTDSNESRFWIGTADVRMQSDLNFGWTSSATNASVTSNDTVLVRSAAGIVGLTNALHLTPIASPPRTCDATAEGDLYSDTSHALCWCDASAWQKLSGAGTCA